MKIEQLFNELKTITENKENVFAESGMANWSNKMQYGFFPLGLGILTENNKTDGATPTIEIAEGGVMVLGNDFGTVSYAEKYFDKIGETDGITVKNLINTNVNLDTRKTFFTNYYLGVRDNKKHPKATMRNRAVALQPKYKELCREFFLTQINLLNPSIIICLGHDVKNALIDSKTAFDIWKPKSNSIKKIHIDNNHIIESNFFDNRKFVLIPHPCDLRNFNEYHMVKLNAILKLSKETENLKA